MEHDQRDGQFHTYWHIDKRSTCQACSRFWWQPLTGMWWVASLQAQVNQNTQG
jgi:hypothetical protein